MTNDKLNELLNTACEIITSLEDKITKQGEMDEDTALWIEEFFSEVNKDSEEDTNWKADLDAQDPKWGKNKI